MRDATPKPFGELLKGIDQFTGTMNQHMPSFDEPARKILGAIMGEIQKARADLEREVPAILGELKAEMEKVKTEAEAALARAEGFLKNPPFPPVPEPPPLPKPPPIDLGIGPELRRDLLTRFGWIELPDDPDHPAPPAAH